MHMGLQTDMMILIKGENKTNSVESYAFHADKCDVVFHNSEKVFHYNAANVKLLRAIGTIDPKTVVFKAKGRAITDAEQILDFGVYYRILRSNRADLFYRKSEVEIAGNCLCDVKAEELFSYFKETAKEISLKTENGVNILDAQYSRIRAAEESLVLAKYLNPGLHIEVRGDTDTLIYPFGINQSQRTAVENAFLAQVSIIQGPPGTGKTQTILNIIANAVRRGKTVAVVSNNNSATKNVAEKLGKQNLSFLTAFLGSHANKEQFLESQTGTYPQMTEWQRSESEMERLRSDARHLTDELTVMLDARNRIAEIDRELLEIKPEQFYFGEYYRSRRSRPDGAKKLVKLPSRKLLALWLEYENNSGRKVGFFRKLLISVQFSMSAVNLFGDIPEAVIPFLQNLYYQNKISELKAEKRTLESRLVNYQFEKKMEELRQTSMILFRAELARRYSWRMPRRRFESRDFRGNSEEFTKEYPVILSTTYSVKGTLSADYVYDYLIVDEASQVDLATGVLAFCSAKNIVIVGDLKQLPNVLTPRDVEKADEIWSRYHFDERYHFATHSLLSSAVEIWPQVPSVLLKEHYRCHPKIAGFFNQKFYNGKLKIMTEDHGEPDVMTMYRTAPGNHARGHFNQRQIDVIREEILPKLRERGFTNIGIITPYRDQVSAINRQLGSEYEVATVHKFQGREKDAVVLASVDDVIGEFVDDPNMLNVAVSRAIKSLSVIISDNQENGRTNYGDLAKYIEYNNCQIVYSKVYSVFDLLYKDYNDLRAQYLKKHRRVSEFDSENLAYAVIEKILSVEEFAEVGCVVHSALATLVKDFCNFTEREAQFVSNPLTHVDFLFFHKMNRLPMLAVEIDGTRFHAEGSPQEERDILKNSILEKCGIPLLRIRTDESGVGARITSELRRVIG